MLSLILASLLSHPDYRVREAAESGLLACPRIDWIARTDLTPCPEALQRLARARDAFLPVQETPYLDGLPDDYSDRHAVIHRFVQLAIAAGHARQIMGDWPAYREATRLWLADGGDASLIPDMRRRTVNYNCLGRWEP